MPNLADLELNRTIEPPAPKRTGGIIRAALLAGLVIAIAIIAYNVISTFKHKAPSDVRVQTGTAVVPEAKAPPSAEPGDNILLPPLDETDPLVRELVRKLSSHPKIAAWLATDQLIRNFTVSVVNIAGGQTPVRHLQALRPTGAFSVAANGNGTYINPRSYERYDAYADAVAGVDARGAARLYATLKPRIEDASRQLGNAEGSFDVTLNRAIAELLETPVPEGRLAVQQSPVSWHYVDPKLQSLSAAQRQLLRMGPRNARVIQAKLREIAPYLGFVPGNVTDRR